MRIFYLLFSVLLVSLLSGQDADLMLSQDYENFIDRMVISQKDKSNFHLTMKPYNRTYVDSLLQSIDLDELNEVEKTRYRELQNILGTNFQDRTTETKTQVKEINEGGVTFRTYEETNTTTTSSVSNSKPFLGVFYINPGHFYEHRSKSLYLAIDPILNLQGGIKNTNYVDASFQRGINAIARIDNRVTLYSQIIEGPFAAGQHVKNYTDRFKTLPHYGYFKRYQNNIYKDYPAYDLLYASGGVGVNLTKHIGFKFGYDDNKIGPGLRSTFLSDFAGNYLNLKINWKVWRFHYQNIFGELNENNAAQISGDELVNKKYFALNTLSFYVNPRLSFHLSESVIFSRTNHFEFQYLNPVILYRTVEHAIGSPDNVNLGLGFDWYIRKRLSLYSQLNLDEFKASEFFSGKGWWANKFGLQTGLKFIDFASVPNLDIQLEGNLVKPYTYGHRTTGTTFTHNNAALVYGSGANFYELLGRMIYNPTPRVKIDGILMYREQGLSYGNLNYGEVPQIPYTNRVSDYDVRLLQGIKTKTIYGQLDLTYQLRQNYFWNISSSLRKSNDPEYNELQFGLTTGLRINFSPRDYIF